jgi:DNA-binding transcriptional LysR family regulator
MKTEIDRMLATGQLDMVIGPRTVLPDDLRARVVNTENFRCVLRAGHPFRNAEMTVDDFCALEHVYVSPFGGDFQGDVDAALAALDRKRRVVISVPSVLVATRILETSNFVAVFSESLARREAHLLRSYPMPVDIGKLQLVLAWHERTHVNAAHQWFRDRIANAMRRVAEGSDPKTFEETSASMYA